MIKRILTIILVLAICGCITNGMILPGQKAKVKELPPDVIVIQNSKAIPSTPINTGDDFSVYFEVTNMEEQRYVDYVSYKLLDSGLCCLLDAGVCATTAKFNQMSTGIFTGSGQVFVPKQVELVQWTFRAPPAEDLAYIGTKCPVRFKVNYSFNAITETDVDVISQSKYNALQQSGDFATYVPTLTMGRGPIKVNLTFGAAQPIKVGSSLPVYVTVEDKGAGLYSEIPVGALQIKVPSDFINGNCGARFGCSGNICSNSGPDPIIMIERKSPTFRCTFTTPSSVTSEKVYTIEANLTYNYTLSGQVDVQIKAPSGV
jgi:hypothetical protein